MQAVNLEREFSRIPRDYRECATAHRVYDKSVDAWLELDGFDRRSDKMDSLIVDSCYDFPEANPDTIVLCFDSQGREIGVTWVECALTHQNVTGDRFALVHLGFNPSNPWVKCPEHVGISYAIKLEDFPGIFSYEVLEIFAERLLTATQNEYGNEA